MRSASRRSHRKNSEPPIHQPNHDSHQGKSMSTLRTSLIVVLAAAGLFAAGCDKKPADEAGKEAAKEADKVIATINGEKIMQSDYQNYLQLRQQQVGPIPDKDKEKKVVLDEMIEKTLLAQHAVSNKLDHEPEVSSLMKRVREEILGQAVKRKLLRDNPVTDDDVKKRFEQEVENTHKTEYKVRHILVKEEAEAREILAQLGKGVKFDKLAKDKSVDIQSGKAGGELGRAREIRLRLAHHQGRGYPSSQDPDLRTVHVGSARSRQSLPQDAGRQGRQSGQGS